jgi:hypothetical protein
MLKNPSYRTSSFQELTELSQGNKVLDASGSSTHCYFSKGYMRLVSSAAYVNLDIRAYLLIETPVSRSTPFKKERNSPRETMGHMLKLLTQTVFIYEIHVFL